MYPDDARLAYKVDHVGVVLDGPDEAFGFCRDALGLPVAWELAEYGRARTGGIGLGNLNLELLDGASVGLTRHDPAAIGLVAYQPAPHSLGDLLDALTNRGVAHLGPLSSGDPVFGFTNVVPAGLGFDAGFFCSYHFPGAHDNAVRQAELDLVSGGVLGLRGVPELRVAIDPDAPAVAAVLGPPEGAGRWTFPTGPALVIDPDVEPGTAVMTWSVADVGTAREALIRRGAEVDGGQVRMRELGGLAIRLTSSPPSAMRAARRVRPRW